MPTAASTTGKSFMGATLAGMADFVTRFLVEAGQVRHVSALEAPTVEGLMVCAGGGLFRCKQF